MADKFFAQMRSEGAVVIVGADPENPPAWLKPGALRCRHETDGEYLWVGTMPAPLHIMQRCFAREPLQVLMPTGWRSVRRLCGRLECLLGMAGSDECPLESIPSEKHPQGFKTLVLGVPQDNAEQEALVTALRADGYREFNDVLVIRPRYNKFSDPEWTGRLAQTLIDGKAHEWRAYITDNDPDEFTLDYHELERLEALVIGAVKVIKSGQKHNGDWTPDEYDHW